MSTLHRVIIRAQRRLWLTRWIRALGWSLVGAGLVFVAVVLADRLVAWGLPLVEIALGVAGAAVVGSVVWSLLTREDRITAAARLDENAGLKERLSTGLFIEAGSDPFERAVHRDAERISTHITVRQHIRLDWPDSLGYGLAMTFVAVLFTWLMPQYDLFGREQERHEEQQRVERLAEVRQNVTQQIERIRQTTRKATGLKDAPVMKQLDELSVSELDQPEDLRREAIKKLGKLGEDLKARRNAGQFDAVTQMKNLMRELREPRTPPSSVGQLQQALAKGDFKTATKALKNLQQQIARAKAAGDPQQIADLQKQLSALAKKLDKVAQAQRQANRQLKQAGLNNEQINKLLEKLPQMNAAQIAKALQQANPNLDQQQLQKLAQQMMQNRDAAQAAQQLAENLQKGAGQMQQPGEGQGMGEGQGLAVAAQQLSELEQLQQEMNELEAAMDELRLGMQELGAPPQPGGQPNRPGAGMGRLGQGRGNFARNEQTKTNLQRRKGKVLTGAGRIIGQTFVDGQQFKGDATREFVEAVRAAEHDAVDALADDRLPRKYHSPIRRYYRRLDADLADAPAKVPTDSD